jgi:NTP pyrophosphatase (non-canonical NTP hydrolase)
MKDYQVSILNEVVAKYGSSPQIDMAIEEMSELTKALLKYRRLNYGIHPQEEIDKRRKDIADEIADVEILIFQLRNIFSFDRSYIDDIITEKLERQKLRMFKNDTELKTKP